MQVKSIAECSKGEHSAILSTYIRLPFVIKIVVLSIFEWPLYTGLTVSRRINLQSYPGQRKAVRITLDFHFSPPNAEKTKRIIIDTHRFR